MKIYTKTGDKGITSLVGGSRVSKLDARINAVGDLDELNSVIGLALASSSSGRLKMIGEVLQNQLFDLGALVAGENTVDNGREFPIEKVEKLENWIDELTKELSPLKNFILPGGSFAAAYWHMSRSLARRAERSYLATGVETDSNLILTYLNRLSDLLFTMARAENHHQNVNEIIWKGS